MNVKILVVKNAVLIYANTLNADILIIGGTSLAVYPAAGLIDYYRGHKLVLINKSQTPMDRRADLLIQGSIGEVLGQITV